MTQTRLCVQEGLLVTVYLRKLRNPLKYSDLQEMLDFLSEMCYDISSSLSYLTCVYHSLKPFIFMEILKLW
jgi:hypothetical protein